MAHLLRSRRSCAEAAVALAALVTLALPLAAAADCPPSCAATGGGPAETDCHAEFASTALRLNYPPFDPAAPQPSRELYCFDGDAGCDVEGAFDRVCVFDVDVCLHNLDPNLPSCVPSTVTAVDVEGADGDPDLGALQTAIAALLPAGANVCTEGQRLRVPIVGPDASGATARGHKTVHLTVRTEGGATAEDRLELSCVPRGWPSHGYDHANRRANPFEVALSPQSVAHLAVKWRTELGATVTSTPIVGNGFIYATTWGGNLAALRPDTGEVAWMYHATRGGFIDSSALTADGRLLATAGTTVTCLDANDGRVLWTHDLRVDPADTAWASPEVANGRVFVGIASASDNPCVQGRLIALDLDTGNELWQLKTVPDKVCDNDTAVACTGDGECGGGTCVKGKGGGVTASVAIDPTGEIVYMNTVGCYTFPSIGDSDSIFKIDAASGEVLWKTRVQLPEQFNYCPADGGKDCRTAADCAAGMCRKKNAYHDFGFLNGPILADVDTGGGQTRTLVVSGSKDGTIYALDPADGSYVWKTPVRPTPVSPGFAGFGLFNGADGFADQRFYGTTDASIFNPPLTEHLYAFEAGDGSVAWQEEIGNSWGSVGLAGGLVFAGAGTLGAVKRCSDDETMLCGGDPDCAAGTCVPVMRCSDDLLKSCTGDPDCAPATCLALGPFFVYDGTTGERLRQFLLPANVASGPSIVDGNVYVGYGVFSAVGGVIALGLPTCLGDCNNDHRVAVDELVRGVNIGLGLAAMDQCLRFDGDDSGDLTVDELITGVGHSIAGCD